jgi:hypothetical protein
MMVPAPEPTAAPNASEAELAPSAVPVPVPTATPNADAEPWPSAVPVLSGSDLLIITGRGNHIDDGVVLLWPAVLETLAQLEYTALDAAIDPNNDGCVRVTAACLAEWSGSV